jgi:hypothetical protein
MEYEIRGNLKLDRMAIRMMFRCHKFVKVRDVEGLRLTNLLEATYVVGAIQYKVQSQNSLWL